MGYKNLNLPKGNEELPNGLILISGKNSYGKSTILEGILFAFFGPRIFKGRKAESFITYGAQEKAEIYELLPKIDCGACGSPTCMTFAEDVIMGDANRNDCIFNLPKRFNALTQEMMELLDKSAFMKPANPKKPIKEKK